MKTRSHFKNLFFLLAITFLTAFNSPAIENSKEKNTTLVLNAKGLQFEKVITDIFRGDFIEIPFDRDEAVFTLFLNEYIDAYAIHCETSLPANKVELTYAECVTERVTRDGYGWEVSRTCVEWVDVGRGLYAAPEMVYAKKEIERLQTTDAFRNMYKMMNQQNPIGEALTLVEKSDAIKSDMAKLIAMNGCKSEGLMRFQENLRLFALSKQPIRIDGSSATDIVITATNQNFPKLAEDLVYAHSKTWAMNRYQRGSISNASITSKDSQNRPTELKANYIYQGWQGRSNGSVRITFSEGVPECLYFFDYPSTCRTADRRIVAEFANGGYQK